MPYLTDWLKPPNADFRCKYCKSTNAVYRVWETHDEAHTDYECKCNDCKATWWIEGSDY